MLARTGLTPGLGRRTTLLAAAGVAVALIASPAQASGSPTTSGEAAALLAAKAHQLEVVTEQFDAAREQLAAASQAARQAAAAASGAQADLAAAQSQVRAVARSAYTGGTGPLQALLTSTSAGEFIDRVSTLDRLAGRDDRVVGQAAAAGARAARLQAQAQQAAGLARQRYTAALGQQQQLQAQIAAYQADYNRLSASERQAALAAAENPAGQAAASRAERSTPGALAAPAVTGSGAVQIVLTTALAQRGKPYVWAAVGPDSFDCSGLLQYAFRAAAIALPHSSAMQAQMGTPVSRADARPGDLVFFFTPVSHIGIYLGGGLMVHAPTPGDVIKVASIDNLGAPPRFTRIIG